jgi:hypothetical protein
VHALDLWHPTGEPRRRLMLGALAAAGAGGSSAETGLADTGLADVVVVAPGAGESTGHWLDAAILSAATRLDRDGIVAVLVGRPWRRRTERALRGAGLVLVDALITVPPWPATEQLAPVDGAALGDYGRRHLGFSTRRALLFGLAGRPPALGRALLGRALLSRAPGWCLVAAAPGATPPWTWLETFGGGPWMAALTVSNRDDARGVLVWPYRPGGAAPGIVVKVGLDEAGRRRVDGERRALSELGPAARAAGAAVPTPRHAGPAWALGMDVIPGTSAAQVVAARPADLGRIAQRVSAWLAAWHRSTGVPAGGAEALEAHVLRPLRRVVAAAPDLAAYAEEVSRMARELADRPVVVVAAHNDLTFANVVDSADGIGILDWESATPEGLPTTDLWYALTDGLARADRISHADALAALVGGRSRLDGGLTGAAAAVATAAGASPAERSIALHACWLQHAADEIERGDRDGRFLAVVRSLAAPRPVGSPAR